MKKFAIACAGFALLLANPIFADNASDAAAEAAALKAIKAAAANGNAGVAKAMPNSGLTVAATTGVPPLIGNFILIGADELSAGLPCFFCAPAPAGGFGVALTIPVGYVPSSLVAIDYSFMFQDVSVTGICTLGFALVQGTTVLDAAAFKVGLYPSTWVVTFPRTRPAATGSATAVGLVMCDNGAEQIHPHTTVYLQ